MPSDDSAARVPPSLEADLGKVEENTLGSKDRIAEGTSQLSTVRKTVLLIVFCLAMFLDIFNVASLMSAIPAVAYSLNMNTSESTWIVSAFQLTFSAFLLASGKLSDVFSAKYAFVTGISVLPILSLITGFMHNKIALFVLRALGGIAGSLTIPAALTLIVRIFPQPEEQARAMGIFGATGALGNILGLVIGALLTQYTSWRWVFWFATILAVPAAVIGAIMIPKQDVPNSNLSFGARIKHMDIPGCTVLTVAIVLFILALTEASTSGWKSAIVIAPLVISVLLVVAFFIYEKWLPQEHAAIPSRTWFYKNFSILFGCALVPFFWFTTVFVFCTEHWQTVYHYSVVMATVRMLPVGVAAAIVSFSSPLLHNISVKYILLTGYAGMITGTVLLSQANTSDRYWPFVFPAFIIGGAGTMTIFIFANIGMFRSTPPTMAGTVGALFSSALQLGSAVGLAIVTSIYTSVSEKKGAESYAGRSAGWWFAFGIIIIAALSVAVFYDDKVIPDADTTASASPAEKMHEEKVSDQGSQT